MKVIKKPNAVKRVFVSIRDQGKPEPVKLLIQPKPPNQAPRFIRKRKDSSRCQTPEQSIIKVDKSLSGGKFVYNRSLSPYVPPKDNSHSIFYIPLGSDPLLSIPPIEKDEGLCTPYELSEKRGKSEVEVFEYSETVASSNFTKSEKNEKLELNDSQISKDKPAFIRKSVNFDKSVIFENSPEVIKRKERDRSQNSDKSIEKNDSFDSKRSKRASIRNLGKNMDLSKKVLTKAQLLLNHPPDSKKRENSSSAPDENSTISSQIISQTPSPNISHRNNRCQALSKNFKINKLNFASEVEKQVRGKSAEKDSEAPWLNILKDLDNVVQIKDLPTYQNFNERPRMGVKLRREYCK